jgi:hypothetical protein
MRSTFYRMDCVVREPAVTTKKEHRHRDRPRLEYLELNLPVSSLSLSLVTFRPLSSSNDAGAGGSAACDASALTGRLSYRMMWRGGGVAVQRG